MCLALYMATDHPIHPIPWLSEHPAFHVSNLHRAEQRVRAQFSVQHVFSVGAHTHCACGFLSTEESDTALQRDSLTAFVSFIERTASLGQTELFICWEGEQGESPEHVLDWPVSELAKQIDRIADLSFDSKPSLVRVSRPAA